jgi:IS605 OrfB family transposase
MRSKSNLALLAEQARQRDAKGSVSENALLSAFGQAVTVRFTRHKFGWQLGLTIDEHEPDGDSLGYDNGCLGVDVNADHLAVCVVTRDGNKRFVTDIACPLTGKMDADKRRAIIGDVVKELVDLAKQYEVGIAYEALDFMKKKSALRETGNFQYRSMLSCFAYNVVIESIKRRAFREGVQTRPVTAACTSIIGRLKYQTSKTTVHQAASWVIARRGLGMYKERIRLKVPRVIGEKAFNARQLTVSMAVAPLQRWIRANKVIGYFKKGSVRPEKLCNLKVHDGMLSIYT